MLEEVLLKGHLKETELTLTDGEHSSLDFFMYHFQTTQTLFLLC